MLKNVKQGTMNINFSSFWLDPTGVVSLHFKSTFDQFLHNGHNLFGEYSFLLPHNFYKLIQLSTLKIDMPFQLCHVVKDEFLGKKTKVDELPLEVHHMSVMIAYPQNVAAWYSCCFEDYHLSSAMLAV